MIEDFFNTIFLSTIEGDNNQKTDTSAKIFSITVFTTATLSLISIFALFYYSMKNEKQNIGQKLLIAMSIVNIFYIVSTYIPAIQIFTDPNWTNDDHNNKTALIYFRYFLELFGTFGTFSLMISILLYIIMCLYSQKICNKTFNMAIILSIVASFLMAIVPMYYTYCSYSPILPFWLNGITQNKYQGINEFYNYILVIIYCISFLWYFGILVKMFTSRFVIQQDNRSKLKVHKFIKYYPLIFLICWLPITIQNIYTISKNEILNSYYLGVFCYPFMVLNGFGTVFFYKILSRKEQIESRVQFGKVMASSQYSQLLTSQNNQCDSGQSQNTQYSEF